MSEPEKALAIGGTVRELVSYPVKGCGGIPLSQSMVALAGLAHDRSFMVVGSGGVFRSQRRDPRLAVIQPQINVEGSMTGRRGRRHTPGWWGGPGR